MTFYTNFSSCQCRAIFLVAAFFFLSASHSVLLYRRATEIHFYSSAITQKQHIDIGVKNRMSHLAYNIMCLHLQRFFYLLFAFRGGWNFSHSSLSSEALVRAAESTHQSAFLLLLRKSANSKRHTFRRNKNFDSTDVLSCLVREKSSGYTRGFEIN